MKDAFEFAAQGCPDDSGEQACAEIAFPSFYELSLLLDAKADGIEDPFVDVTAEGLDHDHDQGDGCAEGEL